MKAGAVGAITAGVLNASVLDNAATGTSQSINQFAGVTDVGTTGARVASFDVNTIGQSLEGMAMRGVVNAGANELIYGKSAGSFGSQFVGSFVSDLAAVGANAVGQTWGAGQNPVMQTIAHAGIGAASAALTNRDALAGAIGGATESVLGNLVDLPTDPQGNYSAVAQGAYTEGATLLGGLISAAAGRDPLTAMQAAQNAAVNNRLMEDAQLRKINQLAGSDATKATEYKAVLAYMQNGNVNGVSGPIGVDASADALYQQGAALLASDLPRFQQLYQQLRAAGVTTGQFSYGLADYLKDTAGSVTGGYLTTATFADAMNGFNNLVTIQEGVSAVTGLSLVRGATGSISADLAANASAAEGARGVATDGWPGGGAVGL